MIRALTAAALAAAVPLVAAAPAAAQAPGAMTVATCRPCHTLEKGGRNGVGPNLYGVIDRPAGTVAGFTYSAALKGSGLKWDEKTLDAYLVAPMKKVPGSKMPIGVADPAKRRAVIDYLRTAAK